MAVFIGIVGHKKSGKTTLIERLAANMKSRGITIGTIKITSHDLEFDSPGKDTYRHRKAGAAITLINSKNNQAIFTDGGYLDFDLVEKIFAGCRFVFIEGDNDPVRPCIYIADINRIRDDAKNRIIAFYGDDIRLPKIPNFAIDNINGLCDFIIERFQNA
jgi:molybdopterin-guanine dinucleotide biosynthesis protein B